MAAGDPVIDALVRVARAWRDPDHAPRREAVARTLALPNRFTAEALAFAVNQQMALVTVRDLERWVGDRRTARPRRVGVLAAGNVPMADFQDYLAVTATGHQFVGSPSARSPHLLPAFADEVRGEGGPVAEFIPHDELFEAVDAVIGAGTNETMDLVDAACEKAGIPPGNRLLRRNRFGIAVIDGREHREQRIRLAEDLLLHEGLGCRNVALVFAPVSLSPDGVLEAMAVFRGTFPAHRSTPGTLRMQQAFLKAVGAPHAFGDDLAFLVSRGDPEVQAPGHVRWVPYDSLDEVCAWIDEHAAHIQVAAARPAVRERLPASVERVALGETQRPPLDWRPDGIDTPAFLAAIV